MNKLCCAHKFKTHFFKSLLFSDRGVLMEYLHVSPVINNRYIVNIYPYELVKTPVLLYYIYKYLSITYRHFKRFLMICSLVNSSWILLRHKSHLYGSNPSKACLGLRFLSMVIQESLPAYLLIWAFQTVLYHHVRTPPLSIVIIYVYRAIACPNTSCFCSCLPPRLN